MSFNFTGTSSDPQGTHHSSPNSIHHQQYRSPLTGSSSSSTGGSPTAAAQIQAATVSAANIPLMASIANVKDSRWLTLEVCREYQRGKCARSDQECKFAHPPTHVEVNSGKVVACFDSLKGKCNRTNPPCKYLHPPSHLRDILVQNGRNNLILRSIAMNIAANQSIYPQTPTHLSYPNGAILPNHLQQTATLASYQHMGPPGPAQSTLLFNQAGQAFSIPLQHLQQATTAMYGPDGTPYFSPMTTLTGQATGPKPTRTDRLESYLELDTLYQQQNFPEDDGSYANGFVSAYQPYPGQFQTIYTRAPSVDLKDPSFITSNGDGSSTTTDINAVTDPVSSSSSSSITQQTKKRPLEDDTATTGAYLQLPPGTQLLPAPQYIQQPTNVPAHHQKRSAIADPKTGIPMAAYPVAAYSYPSASQLPMQFQQQYLTAVPMAFTGYTSHLPRL